MKHLTLFLIALTFAMPAALAQSATAQSVPESRAEISLTFAPVVKATAPAVVNIYAKVVVKTQQRNPFNSPLFDDPLFKRFFGENFGRNFGRPKERVQNALGSGVILSKNGIVVTNHHVIRNAQEIRVVLANRREFDGEVLLSDERTDIAVVRLKDAGDDLPTAKLGDSDAIEVGDLVLAIGNPFGVGQTVTSGIVSGLARTAVGIADFQSFIQTDAAINPGNSGGALVALDGSVVGINTAIFSKSGGSMGIGFAVPSNMVSAIVESAEKGEPLVRPWLGFTGRDVDADMAHALGFVAPMGVIVEGIYPDGPAERAGLSIGDVVTAVSGRQIEDAQALRFRAATRGVGGMLTLGIIRNGDNVSVNLPLESPPEIPPRDPLEVSGRNPFSGAILINMSPAVASEYGLPNTATGVFFQSIRGGGTADRVGFKPGDKLVAVSGVNITDTAFLRRVLQDPPKRWRITMERNGKERTFDVR